MTGRCFKGYTHQPCQLNGDFNSDLHIGDFHHHADYFNSDTHQPGQLSSRRRAAPVSARQAPHAQRKAPARRH